MLELDLGNHVALVTGATGELGRVIAVTLAHAGADLILHYHRDPQPAHELANRVRELGCRAIIVQGDITREDEVARLRERSGAELSLPDIVIANAVEQIHPWSHVLEESLADYESQFRSCVLQSVLLAKAFVPHMRERGWGRYIGINTECTMQLFPGYSAYAAGKRGMDGVLRVLAREVGAWGITVNQVAPGWTISDKDRPEPRDDAEYVRQVPLRRRGTDQEVANAVAFLASDLASFVHGAFLPVCGGNVMPTV